MNILSIGNSFSCDAQRYLHRIAKADGVELNTFNLYIGGCPLAKHYRNMLSQQQEYVLEMNGNSTGFKVSLQEALLNRAWDVVTVQQASRNSVDYDSYQPYLDKLVEYVRMCVPKAKIIVHQTWAYAQESPRLAPVMGYSSYKQMLADLMSAYEKAAAAVSADDMIPAGEVLDALLENGIEKVHRDCHHASCGVGRYAIGLMWYKILTGNDVTNNTFADFDEEIPAEQVAIAKKCVMEIAAKHGK